jgi:hypothetical protein
MENTSDNRPRYGHSAEHDNVSAEHLRGRLAQNQGCRVHESVSANKMDIGRERLTYPTRARSQAVSQE